MEYALCPRCQFRMISNKRMCETCGNERALSSGIPTLMDDSACAPSTDSGQINRIMDIELESADGYASSSGISR